MHTQKREKLRLCIVQSSCVYFVLIIIMIGNSCKLAWNLIPTSLIQGPLCVQIVPQEPLISTAAPKLQYDWIASFLSRPS